MAVYCARFDAIGHDVPYESLKMKEIPKTVDKFDYVCGHVG